MADTAQDLDTYRHAQLADETPLRFAGHRQRLRLHGSNQPNRSVSPKAKSDNRKKTLFGMVASLLKAGNRAAELLYQVAPAASLYSPRGTTTS